MLVHWIWLATRPNLPDRLKIAALELFHDPEALYYGQPEGYGRIEGISEEGQTALRDKDLSAAEKVVEQCMKKNIHICTFYDAAYPRRLKNIPDPPVVLYYKGTLPEIDANPVIGVVGTRHASAYGIGIAKRMGYQIAKCGGMLVSGIASGIDGVAMQGALTAGGCVIGVLGNGADVVYPPSNRALFADLEQRGCLLTEFPPGTPPLRWNFPKRNRVISALSNGVLVVEAPKISGALITARQAAEQGRDVFVVPGNVDVPTCVGSNALLREGAIAVSCGNDILSEYESMYPGKIRRYTVPGKMAGYEDEALAPEKEEAMLKVAQKTEIPKKKSIFGKKTHKIPVDKEASSSYSDGKETKDLTQDEQALLRHLSRQPRLLDDVIAELALPAGKVLSVLTMLQIKGMVEQLPGKYVRLK